MEDRVVRLRDMIAKRFLRIDIHPLPSHPLHMEVALRRLPGLAMMSTYSLGVRMQRTRELAADGDDCFCLGILSAGVGMIRQGDQEITLEHGDAVLLSGLQPFSVVRPAISRSWAVTVSSAALALLVTDIEAAIMRPIPRSAEVLVLLAAYLRSLEHELALTTPELRGLAVSHVYDLVALAVGATRHTRDVAQERGVPAARLRAIKTDISENLRRTDLSIETMAARHGVTTRYVRKLFENEGTTFSEFVLEQRLQHAHRFLTDPRFADRAISGIAFECGFGDLSYFNRTFRRMYGAAPTDVRHPARPRTSAAVK